MQFLSQICNELASLESTNDYIRVSFILNSMSFTDKKSFYYQKSGKMLFIRMATIIINKSVFDSDMTFIIPRIKIGLSVCTHLIYKTTLLNFIINSLLYKCLWTQRRAVAASCYLLSMTLLSMLIVKFN